MPVWQKKTDSNGNSRLEFDVPVNSRRAKRETGNLLHNVCTACIFLSQGTYGMLDAEGYVGERERIPYRTCPGIGRPEAKC